MDLQEIKEQKETRDIKIAISDLYDEFVKQPALQHTVLEKLHVLMKQIIEPIDSQSYVHIQYMEGMVYEQNGNKNAARYCAMRILHIQECLSHPKYRRSSMILYEPYPIEGEQAAFMERYTDFIQGVYQSINKKLLLISFGISTILFVVIALLFHVNPMIAIIEALLIGCINYLLQKRKMPQMFQKNQTDASGKYIDTDLEAFESRFRY